MRVVYVLTVGEAIGAAKRHAKQLGRQIERVVLTTDEHRRLAREIDPLCPTPPGGHLIAEYMGVQIAVEE